MVVNVTPQRAHEMITRGEVAVIDVRAAAEWEKGHVPGARLMPLEDVRANPASLPREDVLFVCAGGVRSQTAARVAYQHGVKRVYSLTGGTLSWIKAGLPLALPLDIAV
jgi:adenylyltransferase/sulfurtransferase